MCGSAVVALVGAGALDAEELGDLGPGAFLVAGVRDGLGQAPFGFGDEADEEMQSSRSVTEPGKAAEGAEIVNSCFEDSFGVFVGGRREVAVPP